MAGMTPDIIAALEDLTRPIVGIENRTAQEAFDIMADRVRRKFAALSTSPAGQEVREKIGGGEFFVDGDKFDLIFRPGGGSYGGADKIVARMACGDTAYWLPCLVARMLNAALSSVEPAGNGREGNGHD